MGIDTDKKGKTTTSFWHALSSTEIFELLDANPQGLMQEESTERSKIHGKNSLPAQKLLTVWQLMLHQLLNPLIFILTIAAVAALFIGEYVDTGFIILVIAINTALGTFQEYKAQKSASELQKLLKIKARVLRNGQPVIIDSEDLVPGDVVLLESGLKVPADLRLFEEQNLTSDESFLTGESIAASKSLVELPEETSIGDRRNMVFAGATINTGRGKGVVVATGSDTQVGIIAGSVTKSETAKPPLVMRMERFSMKIGLTVIVVSILIGFLLRMQGYDFAGIFFFIVALTVSAIPEGLPVAVTVALSVASKRMSKRNVIVRKLMAVESLGSCTIIASDKTGTLTVNQQTARQLVLPSGRTFNISGEGYRGDGRITTDSGDPAGTDNSAELKSLMQASVLANEAVLKYNDGTWQHQGDAMDVAFLAMALKSGIDPEDLRKTHPLVKQIPYESELKYAAAFYESDGSTHAAAKGAVETILGFCRQDASTPVKEIKAQALTMASEGYRVLAVAGGPVDSFDKKKPSNSLHQLGFYGLVGFIDPLRPESADAVLKSQEAGIRVLMITGDHPATAGAIARQLSLISSSEKEVITGDELREARAVGDEAFSQKVQAGKVFARVSPVQKLEIVEALILSGEFVAVTGDGVNDTPALRRANIGVAMGSGTDAAKEVGSMIIADDDFSSIVAGVEEGRYAYDNVRKVIYLLVSTGAAEVFLFITAVIAQVPMPLLAVQILWLNLVTNGIQHVALSFEAGESGAMQRPPRRPNESIFNPLMMSQTIIAGLAMGAIAFAAWYDLTQLQGMPEPEARNIVLLLFVLLQNAHVFNCRSERTSLFGISIGRNPLILAAVILAQGIHLLSMQIPIMQNVLSIAPVAPEHWFNLLGSAALLIVVMEIFKVVNKRYLKMG